MALLSEVCSEPSLTLTECARRTELPASTALRLLRTLEQSGFVTRDAHGSFEAGPRMMQIGTRALSSNRLVTLARPVLAAVVDQTGESTYLALPGPGRSAVYAAAHEGTQAIRHSSWVGRAVGLDAYAVRSALGGDTAPEGYLATRGHLEPDITAVSSAVRSETGVVAALTILGPSYRLAGTALSECGAVLAAAARSLEIQLGTFVPTTVIPTTPVPTTSARTGARLHA